MEEFGFSIDSEYIEAQSFFDEDPESTPKEVIVWTESDDDIRLWMQVFIDNDNFTFTFRPASMFQTADGISADGCSRLIKLYDTKDIIPGKHNIICLDSDFKFIAKKSACYVGRDYSTPFFYWTRVHSKEHLFLDSNLLDQFISHSACVPAGKLKQSTTDIYSTIAETIYPSLSSIIFLMSLSFDKLTTETEQFKIEFRDRLFILLRMKRGILDSETCEVWSTFAQAMQELDESLTTYISENNNTEKLLDFRQKLTDSGITTRNIYLFTRGHDWESIAKHITKCHLELLQEQKFNDIKANSKQSSKDIQAVLNRTPKLDQALLALKPLCDRFPFFQETLKEARAAYGSNVQG